MLSVFEAPEGGTTNNSLARRKFFAGKPAAGGTPPCTPRGFVLLHGLVTAQLREPVTAHAAALRHAQEDGLTSLLN